MFFLSNFLSILILFFQLFFFYDSSVFIWNYNMGACMASYSQKLPPQKQITSQQKQQIVQQILVTIENKQHQYLEQVQNSKQNYSRGNSLASKSSCTGSYVSAQSLKNQVSLSNSYASNVSSSFRRIQSVKSQSILEENNSQDQQFSQQLQNYEESAKNINNFFYIGDLLSKGNSQQDNLSIANTFNIKQIIKLEVVQLKNKVTYQGHWLNAKRHGFGIQVWKNGSRYQGYFMDNMFHGQGILQYSDGDIYQGEWAGNLYNGQGKYTCKSGRYYEGCWVSGKRQGYGVQIWEDGQMYEGQFKKGYKDGKGKIIFKDQSYYEGDFKNNEIHGVGKYVWLNQKEYIGQWRNNKMNGKGVMTLNNGQVYSGQFSNDKYHGKGQMKYDMCKRYIGDWKYGKRHGQGEIFEGNKLKCWAIWIDGKKVKKGRQLSDASSLKSPKKIIIRR